MDLEYEHFHPQVLIPELGFSVDEKLVGLIKKLWYNQIYTDLSCQENKPGICWICFSDPVSAEMFLNKTHKLLMFDFGWAQSINKMKDNEIHFNTVPINFSEEIINDEVVEFGSPNYKFDISIRFPARLIPEIEELF